MEKAKPSGRTTQNHFLPVELWERRNHLGMTNQKKKTSYFGNGKGEPSGRTNQNFLSCKKKKISSLPAFFLFFFKPIVHTPITPYYIGSSYMFLVVISRNILFISRIVSPSNIDDYGTSQIQKLRFSTQVTRCGCTIL